ncbi:hypothetical protein H7F15_19020 [Pontibacter sp. Tf4]|uniref:hypothetical protein n=1 Tax=Pontibacter sp. Tf4 TaxID=2761620 RepID=UPI00162446EC|nr:hypothetical protein [Pontibacter sp. Tf4]MBB6613139.1 hypothetical protein [Pontibacter sp. Tf4]
MNNDGIGVVINALTDLNSEPEGLPVAFVTRGILNQGSGGKALDFVKSNTPPAGLHPVNQSTAV